MSSQSAARLLAIIASDWIGRAFNRSLATQAVVALQGFRQGLAS